MVDVAIAQSDDVGRAIEEALEHLQLEDIVRDKVVAVKPNETSASPDDSSGITQPDTLKAVLCYLKRLGPRTLVVSGGSGAGETDEIMRMSGMMAVVEEEQVEFVDHNRPPFQEVKLSYRPDRDFRGPQQAVMVNPRVLEYDTIVSLAQLKVHSTATVTLTMKNIAMSFPAADFYGHPRHKERHEHGFFDDMHSFIAAMNQRFPINLGIIVGHPAMVGKGPLGGHTVETGIVIASRDPVAADAAGAYLLGFDVQAVRHLWEAQKAGLGEADQSKMTFPGMDLDAAYRAFTERVYGAALSAS